MQKNRRRWLAISWLLLVACVAGGVAGSGSAVPSPRRPAELSARDA